MIGRRIALLLTLVCGIITNSYGEDKVGNALPSGTVQLHGAGATFPEPLYKKWIAEYQKRHPQIAVSYKGVGSGEGVKEFMAETVDFGASDAAMTDEEMAAVTRGVQLVPITAGAIVLAYNLAGLGGPRHGTRRGGRSSRRLRRRQPIECLAGALLAGELRTPEPR